MATYLRENIKLTGSAPDLQPAEAPSGVWNDTNNLVFVDGETRRLAGQAPVMGTPLFGVRFLAFYTDIVGQPFWVYGGPDGIGVTDGATHWDITPAAWTPAQAGSFMAFAWNGFVIIHSSTAAPVYWGGVPTVICEPLPAWPSGWRFIAMRPHKNFLFGIGQLNEAGQQRVVWSDAAEAGTLPTAWEPAPDNFAGSADLGATGTPCIEGVTIRDVFLVMKGEAVFGFSIGGPDVFSIQQIFDSVGIMGVNAWTQGPNDQVLFVSSAADVILMDGATHQSVMRGQSQRTFYQEVGTELFYNLCAVTLDREEISLVGYPVGGDDVCTRAFTFNWNTGESGFADLANVRCLAGGRLLSDVGQLNSWDGDDQEWNLDQTPWNFAISGATNDDVILGTDDPALLAFQGNDLNGATLTAYAFKQGQGFGDTQMKKLAVRAWPRVLGTDGDTLQFRFGGQETANGPISWTGALAYDIGSGAPLNFFVQGRFIAIEVTSSGDVDPWRMGSLDLEFRDAGLF